MASLLHQLTLSSSVSQSFHSRSSLRRLPLVASASHDDNSTSSPAPQLTFGRRHLLGAAAVSISPLLGRAGNKAAAEDVLSEWERVDLPIDPGVVLLDIAFVPDDPSRGFLLGTRQTILETKDGGNTWAPRSIPSAEDEDFNYRFNSISFKGEEGWIVGKPAILLYTADAGDTWQRIPLSAQLPGDMHYVGGGITNNNKEDRPRFFDSEAQRNCWDKAKKVPGRDPERWRIDAAGNIVCKRLHRCQGCLCYEYDHIVPFSRGGESVVKNCQILQTRANRLKSDKNILDQSLLKVYSCDIKFNDEELDVIEMAVYGNVTRPGKECVVGSIDAMLKQSKSRDRMITCRLHSND